MSRSFVKHRLTKRCFGDVWCVFRPQSVKDPLKKITNTRKRSVGKYEIKFARTLVRYFKSHFVCFIFILHFNNTKWKLKSGLMATMTSHTKVADRQLFETVKTFDWFRDFPRFWKTIRFCKAVEPSPSALEKSLIHSLLSLE